MDLIVPPKSSASPPEAYITIDHGHLRPGATLTQKPGANNEAHCGAIETVDLALAWIGQKMAQGCLSAPYHSNRP
jgi:hypothetical protein